MSMKQIKDFWQYMGSKVIVHGKGEETFDEWVDREYTIDYLIHHKYLKQNAKHEKDFALIRKKTDPDRLIYIRKVLNKGYNDGEIRVKYANIHTVKGLTFDNVIVDLSVYRRERDVYEPIRLAYVAYSRGKIDCWSIGTSNFKDMPGGLAGIQNNRREILKL